MMMHVIENHPNDRFYNSLIFDEIINLEYKKITEYRILQICIYLFWIETKLDKPSQKKIVQLKNHDDILWFQYMFAS